MQRRTLCILVCLALLASLAPTALAATAEPSETPDQPLQAPSLTPAAIQSPANPPVGDSGNALSLFPAEPAATGGQCTASTQCQSGANISCQGSYCDVYPGCWIVCDCEEILCPPPVDPNAPPCPWPRSIC